jgi:RHS repeat-associated protein
VTHTYSNVVVAYDYYPYGLPMENRKLEREETRHNYQGEYAEKDEETGYLAFQLRFYDARIGRWVSPDPYGQYASPYVGMGNLAHMSSDPDGGWSWATAAAGAALGGTVGAMYGLATDPDNWGWYAAGGAVGGGVIGGASFSKNSSLVSAGSQTSWMSLESSLALNPGGLTASTNAMTGLLRGYLNKPEPINLNQNNRLEMLAKHAAYIRNGNDMYLNEVIDYESYLTWAKGDSKGFFRDLLDGFFGSSMSSATEKVYSNNRGAQYAVRISPGLDSFKGKFNLITGVEVSNLKGTSRPYTVHFGNYKYSGRLDTRIQVSFNSKKHLNQFIKKINHYSK